jgi:hypothetical protein
MRGAPRRGGFSDAFCARPQLLPHYRLDEADGARGRAGAVHNHRRRRVAGRHVRDGHGEVVELSRRGRTREHAADID